MDAKQGKLNHSGLEPVPYLHDRPREPMHAPPAADPTAALRVLLKLLLIYAIVTTAALLIRAAMRHWLLPNDDYGHPAPQRALLFHAALAVGALLGLGWQRIPASSDAHRWGCRALLMSAPVILLVSADLLISIDYAPPPPPEKMIFMRDPKLHWRFEPGAHATVNDVPVSINAHGLRGPLVPYTRRDDEFRILFVGDSTTAGSGVAHEDAFVAQIQRWLPRFDNRAVTVINAGVFGYTTWQERLMAEECMRYAPDLVVLGYCPNDLSDYDFSFPVFAGGRWLKHSGIFRAAQRWRHGTRGDAVPGRKRDYHCPSLDDLFAADESESLRRAWAESLNDLAELHALCTARGIGFMLLYIPAQVQVTYREVYGDRPQRRLAAFAAERGVPFVDPLPRLLAMPLEEAANCYVDTWHWSPQGHRVAAELLVEALRRKRGQEP